MANLIRAATAAGLLMLTGIAQAGPTKAAKELVEGMIRKFGSKAAGEGVESLTRKAEGLLLKYGDDAAKAIERAGPRAFRAAEEAGVHARPALKAITKYGDEGAAFVASSPKGLALAARHGDDAAAVLVKHKGVVEDLVEAAGEPAIKALGSVAPRGGRQLVMLHQGGDLAKMGRTPELLAVVTKYGDAAADFVWRNKGSLAVAAVLGTFLSDPEPYLTGAKELATEVVKPLAAVPAKLAEGATGKADWTVVLIAVAILLAAAAAYLVWRYGPRPRRTNPHTENRR